MNKALFILVILAIASCKQEANKAEVEAPKTDNVELKTLYKADQSDRQTGNIDWEKVSVRDEERQKRIYEMLDSNLVVTSEDFANAAMIFQHGRDTVASGMAVKLMRKAIKMDTSRNKWLLAAAVDRDLMRRELPQIYGTQYRRMGADEPWVLYEIDTTKITDEERIEFGVETLAEQREKVKMMNKKKLSELLQTGESVDAIIALIKNADLQNSEYNLSESGINVFAYQIMGEGKDEEALKIFKLNTELYPEGFNTYDSYGECLVKMDKIKEGIIAYKKSLELNPDNDNAKKVLEEIEKN